MEFTNSAYINMLNELKTREYEFANYNNYKLFERPVILRHDVDFSLEKALEMAKLEKEHNVTSIYFVLLTSDFYNIYSKKSYNILKEIIGYGHEIGLHFDETRYEIHSEEDLKEYINIEIELMSKLLNQKSIDYVSMHRPSKWILVNKFEMENVINTYTKEFMNDFKYISDSRMYWREDIIENIQSGANNKLHILTHPFWYEEEITSLKFKISSFLKSSKLERYDYLSQNFRDLEEVILKEEI